MKTVEFAVQVGSYNELFVEMEVTDEECKRLKKYSDRFFYDDFDLGFEDEEDFELFTDAFEDTEEVTDIYAKVVEVALDEMANSLLDNPDGAFEEEYEDPTFENARQYVEDNYDFVIEWPEIEEK